MYKCFVQHCEKKIMNVLFKTNYILCSLKSTKMNFLRNGSLERIRKGCIFCSVFWRGSYNHFSTLSPHNVNVLFLFRFILTRQAEATTPVVFYKKICSYKLRKFHRKTPILESLLNTFWRPVLKRDSNTGAFLWNLRNFQEHLFWRTSANDCFCRGFDIKTSLNTYDIFRQ